MFQRMESIQQSRNTQTTIPILYSRHITTFKTILPNSKTLLSLNPTKYQTHLIPQNIAIIKTLQTLDQCLQGIKMLKEAELNQTNYTP